MHGIQIYIQQPSRVYSPLSDAITKDEDNDDNDDDIQHNTEFQMIQLALI